VPLCHNVCTLCRESMCRHCAVIVSNTHELYRMRIDTNTTNTKHNGYDTCKTCNTLRAGFSKHELTHRFTNQRLSLTLGLTSRGFFHAKVTRGYVTRWVNSLI